MVSITSQALLIIHNPIDCLKSLSKLSRTCSKRQKKREKICLMIYHNTPLSSSLPSPIQVLQSRSARSDLPMSNVARKQLDFEPEQLRSKYKNKHLPSRDLHLGQDIMFQDSTSKQWFPATITSPVFRAKDIKDNYKEGDTYRKTQVHLKSFTPKHKKSEDEHCLSQSSNMHTVKSNCKKCHTVDNQTQSYSRPKRDIKPPIKLDL